MKLSQLEYRWYVTFRNDLQTVEGAIRSVPSGEIIYPELQWEYLTYEIAKCITVR